MPLSTVAPVRLKVKVVALEPEVGADTAAPADGVAEQPVAPVPATAMLRLAAPPPETTTLPE
jgi:hypothetical protein